MVLFDTDYLHLDYSSMANRKSYLDLGWLLAIVPKVRCPCHSSYDFLHQSKIIAILQKSHHF